jgi:hypothetical protein
MFFVALFSVAASQAQTLAPLSQVPRSEHEPLIQKRVGELLFDPAHPSPVSFQDDELSMRLDYSKPRLGVVVQRKGEPEREILLPEEIVQVDEILKVVAGRAIALGWLNGDVRGVAVLDVNAGTLGDAFWAYIPALAPNGRYLAFVKFYPPHGYSDTEGPEDHYMLYDLSRTAAQNRPPGVNLSNSVVVGTTVYPPSIGNRETDNFRIPNGKGHDGLMEQFFWSGDSSRFVFADRYQGELALVLARVGGTGSPSSASVVRIPFGEVCRKSNCEIHLSSVIFDPNPAEGVTVIFTGVGGDAAMGNKSFHYRERQFKPAN